MKIRTFSILLLVGVFLSAGENLFALDRGAPAPSFNLESNRGGRITLDSYRGKVVYLDMWASWCSSCKQSLAWMSALQEKFAERPFAVVTVNVDESRALAERALNDAKADLVVGFDPEGKTPETYGLDVMPTSYLIGVDGKVIAVFKGFKDSDAHEIEKRIADAFPRS